MFSQVQPYRHLEPLQPWSEEHRLHPNHASGFGIIPWSFLWKHVSYESHRALKADTKVPGGGKPVKPGNGKKPGYFPMWNVHETVKVKSELQWRPHGIEDIKNLEHLWRKVTTTKAICRSGLCYREPCQAGKGPTSPPEPRWWHWEHRVPDETGNTCSAVLWFSVRALFLYCIPLFLLGFRMSFCDVLYWKYVIISVVFVVVSTYFVFLPIFLELIVPKKYWTVRLLIWTVKSMGALEVGLEVLCTLSWAWGSRGEAGNITV